MSREWQPSLNQVDQALVRLSLAEVPEIDRAALTSFLAELDADQERELGEKILLNDVAPQVLLNLERLELDFPLGAGLRESMEARREEIRSLTARRMAEGEALFRELGERGIDVILLKGGLFGQVMWHEPAYKKMNDLDVLIRPEDVPDVVQVYRERGYLPLVLFEGGDPDRVRVDKTHHLPSFVSRDLSFVIGTHWGLCSPKKGFDLDHPRMWEDSVEVPFQGTVVRRLSHEDNFHHLAIHFHHYKTGLKELSDVYNYAHFAGDALDWGLLERRILAAGTGGKAHYLFSLAEVLRPLGAPQSFFLALERAADAFSLEETRLRLGRLDLLLSSRSLYESVIEKAYTRYMLETCFHRKLRFFLVFFSCLLFPPRWVLERTNVVDRVTFENYPRLFLANLSRTARVIGEGLGHAVFVLVCLKGCVEILASLKNYVVPPRDDPMSLLLEAVDGDEERLRALMEFLE